MSVQHYKYVFFIYIDFFLLKCGRQAASCLLGWATRAGDLLGHDVTVN